MFTPYTVNTEGKYKTKNYFNINQYIIYLHTDKTRYSHHRRQIFGTNFIIIFFFCISLLETFRVTVILNYISSVVCKLFWDKI